MSRITKRKNSRTLSTLVIVAGLGLAVCLSPVYGSAQQNQPQEAPTGAQATQDALPQAPQDQATTQNQPSVPQTESSAQPQSTAQGLPSQNQAPPPTQASPPQSLTLPAGTVIRVRTDEWISSDQNYPGDAFSVVLDQPIVVNGWVVARRGQSETARVSMAKKAGHGSGISQLGVQMNEFTLVDGQRVPMQTALVQSSAGGPTSGQKAAVIGTTTGVGAAIGAVADGGPGAAIGAAAGAVAGAIGVQSTPGRPTVIPPETVLSFRLENPITISTEHSQLAFQPVTQDDYNSHVANSRPQRVAAPRGPGYPPPPPYYSYPYAYGYPYPYYGVPFGFGIYGGYGWGRFGGYRR